MELHLPSYIDSSTLSAWRSCRRKYFWAHTLGLYPTGKSVHLIAGAALAAGMEAARKRVFLSPSDPTLVTVEEMLEAALPAFAREWGDYEAPFESPKSSLGVFTALRAYLEEYHPATDAIQPLTRADGSPAVEYTFAIPLEITHPETNDPFLFVGRFDLLGHLASIPAVVDEKTTSALGATWSAQWSLRGQFMGYIWACQQNGLEINTAVVRGIALLKRETKFATVIETFPQHLIDRWYRNLIRDLRSIRTAYIALREAGIDTAEDFYPYNFADACTSYGNCAFIDLCRAKDPEPFFSNFIHHRWNPLARQPVEEAPNA